MVHYIYKVTSASGKFYIGRHSTDNIEDGYMGSGNWVKKCKKSNTELKKEILKFCKDETRLYKLEEKIISENYDDPLCMNFIVSSRGWPKGKPLLANRGKTTPSTWKKGNIPWNKGLIGIIKQSRESNLKRSVALKNRIPWNKGKHSGPTTIGKKWVNNGEKSILIAINNSKPPHGYTFGRIGWSKRKKKEEINVRQ